MRRWHALIGALFLLAAQVASADYFQMSGMKGGSGWRATITSQFAATDFFWSDAVGFQRGSFTLGTSLAGTVYACELKNADTDDDGDLSDEANCTSKQALSATNDNFELQTGRPYLLFDITSVETSGTSYLSWRGHPTSAGGGGGSGSPPASGVDTELTLFENSDYDGDSLKVVIDAGTDLLESETLRVGPLGIIQQRTVTAIVDGNDLAATNEEGYVRFFNFGSTGSTSWLFEPYTGTSLNHSGAVVTPIGGGRLVGKSLSVFQWGNNSGATEECVYEVRMSDAIAGAIPPAVAPTVLGADAGWTTCIGDVESGPSSNNSQTTGVGDQVVGIYGTHYATDLSSCTCATDDCAMIVAVRHRDAGTDCAQIEDSYVSFTYDEVH